MGNPILFLQTKDFKSHNRQRISMKREGLNDKTSRCPLDPLLLKLSQEISKWQEEQAEAQMSQLISRHHNIHVSIFVRFHLLDLEIITCVSTEHQRVFNINRLRRHE